MLEYFEFNFFALELIWKNEVARQKWRTCTRDWLQSNTIKILIIYCIQLGNELSEIYDNIIDDILFARPSDVVKLK